MAYKHFDGLEEWLIRQYKSGKTMQSIADECYCGIATVYRWLKKCNVRTRRQGIIGGTKHINIRKGKNHPNWKGGILYKGGYRYLLKPSHPGSNKQGYIPEHRFIAEEVLGRPLKKDEVVHHINGIKDDNKKRNLIICKTNYHSQLEQRMANLYKKEHFCG